MQCESALISIKANKNIELTIPFVQLPNHVCFQTTNYDANIIKKSLIIHEENTKKNHKRVVSVYVIQIHVDLHKL